MNTEKKHFVFVYGTLKGMHRGRQIGPATTLNKYVMFDGGFPIVIPTSDPDVSHIPDKAHGEVLGELHEVDDFNLHGLDNYEGYPEFYDRLEVPVRTTEGIEATAWMYIGGTVKQSIPRRNVMLPDDRGMLSWGRR